MRVLQNRHRIVYSICTWKIWAIDFIENVAKWKGSYKPCSHPCSSTPTQTHPHSPLPSQEKAILTHTQPKKSHTHQNLTKKRSKNPHPLTSSQEMVTPSLKKSYLPMHNWKKEFHVSNTWYIRENYSYSTTFEKYWPVYLFLLNTWNGIWIYYLLVCF